VHSNIALAGNREIRFNGCIRHNKRTHHFAKFKNNMQNFSSLSLKDQRDVVWQNRNEIGLDNFLPFREVPNDADSKFRKKVELQAISEEDIVALGALIPTSDTEEGAISDTDVVEATGLTVQTTSDGTPYTTMELELVEIKYSGTMFNFAYKNEIVCVNQDTQLMLAYDAGLIEVGMMLHFNVTAGISPFNRVGKRLFSNYLPTNESNGRINKAVHAELFESILDSINEKKGLERKGIATIAKKRGTTVGKVRAQMKAQRESAVDTDVADLIAELDNL
jgi:hypothetical protein